MPFKIPAKGPLLLFIPNPVFKGRGLGPEKMVGSWEGVGVSVAVRRNWGGLSSGPRVP